MEEAIGLSVTQKFDIERMNRAIESTIDPQQLQVLAKQLLQAWHSQRAATVWTSESGSSWAEAQCVGFKQRVQRRCVAGCDSAV